MSETTFFEFGATFLQTAVNTFNQVFTWLSQPLTDFLNDVPVEIPNSIITYLERTIGDTSLLLVMFGASLSVFIVLTLVKWIIGIVM